MVKISKAIRVQKEDIDMDALEVRLDNGAIYIFDRYSEAIEEEENELPFFINHLDSIYNPEGGGSVGAFGGGPIVLPDLLPDRVDGLVHWFDANYSQSIVFNSSKVVTWYNLASINHLTQETSGKRPEYDAEGLNGRPTVHFDGSDDVLGNNDLVLPSDDASIFVVYKSPSNSINDFVIGNNGGSNDKFELRTGGANLGNANLSNTLPTNEALIGMASVDEVSGTATQRHRVNGESEVSGAVSRAVPKSELYFGASNNTSNHTEVYISEVLIYDRELGEEDKQKIEGYLAHKWGLEGSLDNEHPFKEVAPKMPIEVTTSENDVREEYGDDFEVDDVEEWEDYEI